MLRAGRLARGSTRYISSRSEVRNAAAVQGGGQNLKAPVLDESSVNPRVLNAKYAVRGNVMAKAEMLKKRMADGEKLPFTQVVPCNIGNPHALLQAPLTFHRQVLSVCLSPSLLEQEGVFPSDVADRASTYFAGMTGGMGAYTSSQGLLCVRQEVADFIQERDGHPADPERIYLTNGASEGVRLFLTTLLRGSSSGDGMLTPIPQYPLYSATMTLLGGELVPYYLDESEDWGVRLENLKESLAEARAQGTTVRAITVINPGNPTGNILTESDIRAIIQFAAEENLVILADEVYQSNIWAADRPFLSFKKVACDMGYTGEDGDERLQLVSFHSTSKGFMGECGLRGGYMELHGIGKEARGQLLKLCSLSLCSNVLGQLAMGLQVNPPKQGEASFDTYQQERDAILASLKRRSNMVRQALVGLEGVTCNQAAGALYAFPQLRFPAKAVQAAEREGVVVDEYYCLNLLEQTGIILVPGSGFGQEDGTFHFRTTFLPNEQQMPDVLDRLAKGHAAFMDEHRD